MPRVHINQDKYINADTASFIEGKTRERGLTDKDIAETIGISSASYCRRKKNKKGEKIFEVSLAEFRKIASKLQLTDEDIIRTVRGKLRV
jgi:transcriptional regulator with XRE-family HTH domain